MVLLQNTSCYQLEIEQYNLCMATWILCHIETFIIMIWARLGETWPVHSFVLGVLKVDDQFTALDHFVCSRRSI